MRRLHALGAVLMLLALVCGLPLLLAATIGDPLGGAKDLLAGAVTDRVVIDVLAAVAWLAWGQFAIAVAVELVSGLRRTPVPRRIPGVFAGQQHLARSLVTAALLLAPTLVSVAGPLVQVAAAAPAAVPAPAAVTLPPQRPAHPTAPTTATTTARVTIGAHGPRTWWDLAHTHLGAGDRWHELWALNENQRQPGGVLLSQPGPLRTGWTVLVPAAASRPPGSAETPAPAPPSRVAAATVPSSPVTAWPRSRPSTTPPGCGCGRPTRTGRSPEAPGSPIRTRSNPAGP